MSSVGCGSLNLEAMRSPVVHLELHTHDLAGARELYAAALGWRADRIETPHGAYVALDVGHGVGGGIVECEVRRPLWLPYAEVQDIAAATGRAQERGATVLLAPREGPGGWRSVIATPAGGELALYERRRGASSRRP
jgi:predicted enzyme related to lactoylglutathione lyase